MSTEQVEARRFPAPALKRTRFSEVWHHACRHAGLADSITMHDLRHYYASLLNQHGESVKLVQARLGHKDSTRAAVDLVLGGERRAVAQ